MSRPSPVIFRNFRGVTHLTPFNLLLNNLRLVGLPMFVTVENENKKDGAAAANNEGSTAARVLSPGSR